ncbi:hypothetical protein GXN76_06550 [Kroppenstedtia pulmonis]|uniref:Uncharacterized protein n=1 Tax=Kroppenstedtia pulmonis TaxID=1380685 RepID=A0A7D3XPT4_9BACL|nr:hypothetical protein [Kroppenstedtia pulmonis]QKG84167.1 hypothetical protein GXN76_06550 [Kroppenstedtia pulmonis]
MMRKLDIQVDIAHEYDGTNKAEFHRELRGILEKYFELNSIHIRKEIHTVEVDKINLREDRSDEVRSHEVTEIERQPLVTTFDPHQKENNKLKEDPFKGHNNDFY